MIRALSPAIGTILLIAITVALAGVVLLLTYGGTPAQGPPPRASFDLSASASDRTVVIEHGGGDPVDVSALEVIIQIDGEPIPHQPPVPFESEAGFRAHWGPFHEWADQEWTPGTEAGLELSAANGAALEPGVPVSVDLVVEESTVARLETTASG